MVLNSLKPLKKNYENLRENGSSHYYWIRISVFTGAGETTIVEISSCKFSIHCGVVYTFTSTDWTISWKYKENNTRTLKLQFL